MSNLPIQLVALGATRQAEGSSYNEFQNGGEG